MELQTAFERIGEVRRGSAAVVLNAQKPIKLLLASILSSSHVIVQGAPGTGKTLLVKKTAQMLGLNRQCIHCTPQSIVADLADVLRPAAGDESICHLLSIDEIDRATPSFQSALLELMEDRVFTKDATHYRMARPFSVVATQTNMNSADSFALAESQLDRFGMVIPMLAPNAEQLVSLLEADTAAVEVTRICSADELRAIQECSAAIRLSDKNAHLIAAIIAATAPEDNTAPDIVRRYVKHGAGVRAAQTMSQAARALALIEGRDEVNSDDIGMLLDPILAHRLVLNFSGFANAIAAHSILEAIKQRFF